MRYEKKKGPQDRHLWHTGAMHWWFQTQASPGIAQVKFRSIVDIAYGKFNCDAARVTCPRNLPAVKPPMRKGHGEALKKHHLLQ